MTEKSLREMFRPTVVVPTYNRPDDLEVCIRSILNQTILPHELIIVDDGDLGEPPLWAECREARIQTVYYKKDKPGLTRSKNKAAQLATGDLLFFFDDDVELFPEYIEKTLEVFRDYGGEDLGGVGGWVANTRRQSMVQHLLSCLEIPFLVSGFQEGRVLPSGFTVNYGNTPFPLKNICRVDFLMGGVCAYKKEVFRHFGFSTTYRGFADRGEDKDFACRVGRRYRLMMTPYARLNHYESPKMRLEKFKRGREMIIARYRFFWDFCQKGPLSWLLFWYATAGFVGLRTLVMVLTLSKGEARRVGGMVQAVCHILTGKIRFPEQWEEEEPPCKND